jgi:hypothetical protein
LQLVEGVTKHALTLVQDAFGNYVVQYILDLGISHVCETLVKQLVGHIYYLSTQKFSSNVIEKCLKAGNAETIQFILKELISPPHINPSAATEPNKDNNQSNTSISSASSHPEPLVVLLQDPYGNYVVQTALAESAAKVSRIN